MENIRKAVDVCWLIVLGGFILYKGFELLGHLATLTTVIVGAVFFAYLVFPVVAWLNARLPLGAAIAIVYASILLVIAAAFYVVVPALAGDVRRIRPRCAGAGT